MSGKLIIWMACVLIGAVIGAVIETKIEEHFRRRAIVKRLLKKLQDDELPGISVYVAMRGGKSEDCDDGRE
jgi:hypothetical protein